MFKVVTNQGDGGIRITTHGPLGRRAGTPITEEIRYDLGDGTFRVIIKDVVAGTSREAIVAAADLEPHSPVDVPA